MARTNPFRNIGPALAFLRIRKGLTQSELAKSASMGKGQLSKYENGKELPKLDSLARVVEVLGVPPLMLFYVAQCFDALEVTIDMGGDGSEAVASLPATYAGGFLPDDGFLTLFRQYIDSYLAFVARHIEAAGPEYFVRTRQELP